MKQMINRPLPLLRSLLWLSLAFLPVMAGAWPHWGVSPQFDLRPRYVDTHFVGESNLFQLDGEVDWGTMIYPDLSTNVLVRPHTLHSPFRGAAIDPGTDGVAYVTFMFDMASTSSCQAPPLAGAMPTGWRVDYDASNPGWPGLVVLDEDTLVRSYVFGQGWADTVVPWDIASWPAARYEWRAMNANGDVLAKGDFRLGILTWRSGFQSDLSNVILLHGLSSFGYRWEEVPADLAPYLNVFTLDYPNTGSIPRNAELLGLALADVKGAHVVAHSMGGVIGRYYKQWYNGTGMQRMISLGSPYEGSPYALSSQTLLALTTLMACSFDGALGDLAGAYGSKAIAELADPVGLLGLWGNSHPSVVNDEALLAMCGTRWGLYLPAEMINLILQIPLGRRLLEDVGMLAENSDGIVTWRSALVAPIRQKNNIYLASSHTTYMNSSKNADYEKMIDAIIEYLRWGTATLEARPILPQTRLALKAMSGGYAIHNAFLVAWNGISDHFRVVSPPSDAQGLLASSMLDLDSGEGHYVWAPGFEPLDINVSPSSGPMAYTVTSRANAVTLDTANHIYIVDLQPSAAHEGPRNGKVLINEGDLTTTSATVILSLSCENATEMSITEAGHEATWETYNGGVISREFVFSDSSPGVKEVEVSFRDAQGRRSALATDSIILVDEMTAGSLAISDVFGGAFVVLNGRLTEYQTPVTIAGLAPGDYVVDVFQSDTRYGVPSARSVQVVANQTAHVFFDAYTSHEIPVSWLIEHGAAPTDAGAEIMGAGNYRYWEHYIAGTDPNDPEGYLAVVQVLPGGQGEGVQLQWRSVANRRYVIQRSTNLIDGFTPVATNVQGQTGTTTFTDTEAYTSGTYFYRVEVLRE